MKALAMALVLIGPLAVTASERNWIKTAREELGSSPPRSATDHVITETVRISRASVLRKEASTAQRSVSLGLHVQAFEPRGEGALADGTTFVLSEGSLLVPMPGLSVSWTLYRPVANRFQLQLRGELEGSAHRLNLTRSNGYRMDNIRVVNLTASAGPRLSWSPAAASGRIGVGLDIQGGSHFRVISGDAAIVNGTDGAFTLAPGGFVKWRPFQRVFTELTYRYRHLVAPGMLEIQPHQFALGVGLAL